MRWPELSAVVQPLAGEWRSDGACRAVERAGRVRGGVATLVDTWSQHGLRAIAQVDLDGGVIVIRTVHDLGLMATEILAVADSRSGLLAPRRWSWRSTASAPGGWHTREVPTWERPPAVTVA